MNKNNIPDGKQHKCSDFQNQLWQILMKWVGGWMNVLINPAHLTLLPSQVKTGKKKS